MATVRCVDLRPMLLRAGPIPSGEGWACEIKYDGFRAVVSTQTRSRSPTVLATWPRDRIAISSSRR